MLHLHGSHGGHGAEVGTVGRHQGRLLLHQLEAGEDGRVGTGRLRPDPALPAPRPTLGLGFGRVGAGPWRPGGEGWPGRHQGAVLTA